MKAIVKREYKVEGRNNYYAIDEYKGDVCIRTVMAGIKKQSEADDIAGELNDAVHTVLHDNQIEEGIPGIENLLTDWRQSEDKNLKRKVADECIEVLRFVYWNSVDEHVKIILAEIQTRAIANIENNPPEARINPEEMDHDCFEWIVKELETCTWSISVPDALMCLRYTNNLEEVDQWSQYSASSAITEMANWALFYDVMDMLEADDVDIREPISSFIKRNKCEQCEGIGQEDTILGEGERPHFINCRNCNGRGFIALNLEQ